ncbi:MAG TPA: cellulose binding domain-containing protein [Cellvibrio sp.]|nr:cellulose binding domain-containing protein [Cellvibrio sp.]
MVKLQLHQNHIERALKIPKKMLTALIITLPLLGNPSTAAPQQAEYLDRGVVALPSGSGIFISWRMLGDDPADIAFNVYRNGTKVNGSPITNSTNFHDGSGVTSAAYTVRPIVNGRELRANAAKPTWNNPYWVINLNRPNGGSGYTYSPGDASVGDVDGDGEYEVILKWDPSNQKDNSQAGVTGNVYIDAYKLNGTRLWRIDLGRNIRAGAHYTQFMVYDLDGDGKAEVAAKTAPGTRDGAGNVLGGSNANTDYRNGDGYILTGPEYLTIFNGETGAAMATTDYIPARGNVGSWGDTYGNRVDRFLAGIAYVDGQRPSLIMARGYYTRAVVVAWDWRNGQLTRRWTFDSNNSGNGGAAGQGAHSLTVGDVDNDGKHEVVYGAATIDDNGTLLYSTRFGHGDALHLSDFLPGRPGLEVYMVHESNATGVDMHDARTGQVIWSLPSGGTDVGRGVIMDIDPRQPGAEAWAIVGGLNSAAGRQISSTKPGSINFAAWWDGDLLRELLNSNTIDKWDYANNSNRRLLSGGNYDAASNNGTKSTPALSGDIFGDWREEVIWRNTNNTQLMIFTTTAVTNHKLRTLMHDIQYREAIAWQNTAYNQPPHPSFFIGDGMATPPAPDLFFVGKNPNDSETASSASSITTSRSSSSTPATSSSVAVTSSSIAITSASRSSVASSVQGSGNCQYVVTNDWGNGFTGAIRITNNRSTAINGWNVSWTYAGNTRLSGTWNATVSGSNPYSASNLSWNGTIQPGQSVEFGFQGTYSGTLEEPGITGAACN